MKWLNLKVLHCIILGVISVIGLFFTVELTLQVWPTLFDFLFVPCIFLPISIFIREYDRRLIKVAVACDIISFVAILLFILWMR